MFNRNDQIFLLAASMVLQAIAIFMIPLVYECDAATYFNFSPGNTYRPPLFPLLIHATGQHQFHTFTGTVAAHSILGILIPILIYRILAPMSRFAALFCATVFIISPSIGQE